jgi:plasmid stability protein
MSQITLRNIPPGIEKELRARARKTRKSLNQTINALLGQALGIENPTARKRNLADLAGTWTPEQATEFDKATAVFETIDKELWQ